MNEIRLIDANQLKETIKSTETWMTVPVKKHMCKIIDNAPTVSPVRPQGECEKCDYRKFTETFIDGIVDVISKNGIADFDEFAKRCGDSYLHQDGITKSDTQI